MGDYREALRAAVTSKKPRKAKEVGADSQRVAQRLRDSVIWPERAFEVKKEEHREQIRQEAQDD